MPRHSKRYLEIRQRVDRTKFYSIDEAIDLVKKNATAKFDETMELHLATNIDPKRPEQQIRGTVILPHGTGRTVRVLVFAKGDKAEEAKKAGADVVGGDELVEKILNEGFTDFDVAIATPDMMKSVGKLGKILGPRGLMPSPKSGTVTDDVVSTVREFKMGRVEVRSDKTGSVHLPIGKCSFDAQKLKENLISAYKQIVSMRPGGIKGQFIRKAVLTSTMGVGVKLNLSELEAAKI